MAVFTEVSFDDARTLIARLGLGELLALEGVPSGIENTNYFATCKRGEFVLTIFERLSFAQLPFYLYLMKHLAERGILVPDPQSDKAGELLHTLEGKPAAVVTKLAGRPLLKPEPQHCEQVGAMLARMHLAGQSFGMSQPNLRGLAWWIETVPLVRPFLDDGQRKLIESELAFQQALASTAGVKNLPHGPIHADLFRDNVMFDGDKLAGFFDFYFAGVDAFLFDIAVCLNDWCVDLETGRLDDGRSTAFCAAYGLVRTLTEDEHRQMPAMLRAAALRFWTSRLWDLHLPRGAALLKPHDPAHFERVLRRHIESPWH
jgi:homoserine kinase type II